MEITAPSDLSQLPHGCMIAVKEIMEVSDTAELPDFSLLAAVL